LGFPSPKLKPEKQNAVQFIIDSINNSKAKLDIIALAPLTNIALAFRQAPEIIEKLDTLIMMAGAIDFGNTRPMSEFNVFADPEAAKIVIDSPVKKILVPLDPLWYGGQLNKNEIEAIQKEDNKPWCKMAARLMMRTIEMAGGSRRKYAMGEGAVAPPDLLTVALAVDPSLGEYEELQVFVETNGQYTRGMTMFDRRWNRNFTPGSNENQAQVFLRINQKKYGNLVVQTLAGY
jgi:inosine-uridine nucleoside N-ribohydrolase